MKKHVITTLVVVAAMMFVVGCGGKGLPAGVLDREQMTEFLYHAYQLEGFYAVEQQYSLDSLTNEQIAAYNTLLKQQGITKKQVQKSLHYYVKHPEQYLKIHNDVVAKLDEKLHPSAKKEEEK